VAVQSPTRLKNEYALTPLPFAGLIASLSDALDIAEHTEIRELRRQVRRLEEEKLILQNDRPRQAGGAGA